MITFLVTIISLIICFVKTKEPSPCLDPCLDNFAFALVYGMEGPEGNGYPNPEIIDGILSYLQTAAS